MIVTRKSHGKKNQARIFSATELVLFLPVCRWLEGWQCNARVVHMTATAGSDVVQSGRPIFDDFFQHLWPYIGNNTANVVFQMVKRMRLIRIDQ
ncbi:hypothetical protein TNCV_1094891 [Trichonephila clavipes]|uniref:Uncharacterized protein n=1 Tax=Trichonephila clavipes TaxID=2585209 RepID=A0A8X6RJN9_TRICX|nr:hypothetical protein TNCV_1094891 [Trichonephila clavipes]